MRCGASCSSKLAAALMPKAVKSKSTGVAPSGSRVKGQYVANPHSTQLLVGKVVLSSVLYGIVRVANDRKHGLASERDWILDGTRLQSTSSAN